MVSSEEFNGVMDKANDDADLAAFLAVAALIVEWKVFTLPINYVLAGGGSIGLWIWRSNLDMMKRLVMRLGCEIEFTNRTLAFCLKHEDKLILRESLQRLSRNQIELVDDLEENIS
ncbi:hypothetical protein SELMODRAFT_427614 [Selaginella moellendorffii]|uniref:Uncharacterized protein n=1 Tax=Selaginella moellendorffii TaxID=88036 RepID=D8T063_SELML|nr:hypothetical protein SELMODRAFT_427614 [Selaginella moellendorffii]